MELTNGLRGSMGYGLSAHKRSAHSMGMNRRERRRRGSIQGLFQKTSARAYGVSLAPCPRSTPGMGCRGREPPFFSSHMPQSTLSIGFFMIVSEKRLLTKETGAVFV
ncbi:MAG: hypothetical protein ABF969_01100 [Sporolactobacillus sp.]